MEYQQMFTRFIVLCLFCLACVVFLFSEVPAQQPPQDPQGQQNTQDPNAAPPIPQGVEVMARGPVHEAFATPTAEAVQTQAVNKAPPPAIDEMPPAEKPAGDSAWIGGYWAWDDDRHDYLWVSGVWRSPPPGKKWVAGYWKQDNQDYRWVPGFWTPNQATSNSEMHTTPQDQITYLPAPPTPPNTAAPGQAPNTESFYVPGHWEWRAAGYQTIDGVQTFRAAGYAWVPGYWAKVQPGYVWVAAHYSWSPTGYVYIPGYWDLAIANRGVMYAPVVIDPLLVGPGFVYTPGFIVSDSLFIGNLWIRPSFGHYYYGDYYGGVYAGIGFQSAYVYGGLHYDPLIAYARYENRGVVGWDRIQINLVLERNAGRMPLPPRTLMAERMMANNIARTDRALVAANRLNEIRTATALNNVARAQAQQQARAIQQVAAQRNAIEARAPAGGLTGPRTTAMSVPSVNPVTAKGVTPTSTAANSANKSTSPSTASTTKTGQTKATPSALQKQKAKTPPHEGKE
jgi:hypothetical protein